MQSGLDSHDNLARIWLQQGDPRRALDAARRSFATRPDAGRATLAMVMLANDLDATQHFVDQARIPQRPNGDGFWRAYGQAMDRAGRFDEARVRLEQLTRDWPTEPFAWSARAWVLATRESANRSDLEQARIAAQRAVELSGRRGPVMLATLAEVQFRSGDATAAIATAEELLALLDGDNAEWLTVADVERTLAPYSE